MVWAASRPTLAVFGEMSITGNATATTCTLQNTFYKVTPGWALRGAQGIVASPANSNMTFEQGGEYNIVCSLSVNPSTNGDTYQFQFFSNGTALLEHQASILAKASTIISLTLTGIDPFLVGDVLDVRVACTTSAGSSFTVVSADWSVFALSGGSDD